MFIFRMVMLILNMTDPLLFVVVVIIVLISIPAPVEEHLRRRNEKTTHPGARTRNPGRITLKHEK
jgi:hypothetical protein